MELDNIVTKQNKVVRALRQGAVCLLGENIALAGSLLAMPVSVAALGLGGAGGVAVALSYAVFLTSHVYHVYRPVDWLLGYQFENDAVLAIQKGDLNALKKAIRFVDPKANDSGLFFKAIDQNPQNLDIISYLAPRSDLSQMRFWFASKARDGDKFFFDLFLKCLEERRGKLSSRLSKKSVFLGTKKIAEAVMADAIQGGQVDFVTKLIPYVDLDKGFDHKSRGALHFAVYCLQPDIVSALLPHVNAKKDNSVVLRDLCRRMIQSPVAGLSVKGGGVTPKDQDGFERAMSIARTLLPVSDPKALRSEALQMASISKNRELLELLYPVSDPEDAIKAMLENSLRGEDNVALLAERMKIQDDKDKLSNLLLSEKTNDISPSAAKRRM